MAARGIHTPTAQIMRIQVLLRVSTKTETAAPSAVPVPSRGPADRDELPPLRGMEPENNQQACQHGEVLCQTEPCPPEEGDLATPTALPRAWSCPAPSLPINVCWTAQQSGAAFYLLDGSLPSS